MPEPSPYTIDVFEHRLEVLEELGERLDEVRYRWRLRMVEDDSVIGRSEEQFRTYNQALFEGMAAHCQLCDQLRSITIEGERR